MLKKIIDAELSLAEKSAVIMYFSTDLTMERIGDILGVDKSTVSRNLKRGKKKIEKFLKYSFITS